MKLLYYAFTIALFFLKTELLPMYIGVLPYYYDNGTAYLIAKPLCQELEETMSEEKKVILYDSFNFEVQDASRRWKDIRAHFKHLFPKKIKLKKIEEEKCFIVANQYMFYLTEITDKKSINNVLELKLKTKSASFKLIPLYQLEKSITELKEIFYKQLSLQKSQEGKIVIETFFKKFKSKLNDKMYPFLLSEMLLAKESGYNQLFTTWFTTIHAHELKDFCPSPMSSETFYKPSSQFSLLPKTIISKSIGSSLTRSQTQSTITFNPETSPVKLSRNNREISKSTPKLGCEPEDELEDLIMIAEGLKEFRSPLLNRNKEEE